MHRNFRLRPFFLSFFSTILVLVLVCSLLLVDARGRKLSFNDDSPPFEVVYHADETAQLQVNAFSADRRIGFTLPVKLWHFVADFLCIPHGHFPAEEEDVSKEN